MEKQCTHECNFQKLNFSNKNIQQILNIVFPVQQTNNKFLNSWPITLSLRTERIEAIQKEECKRLCSGKESREKPNLDPCLLIQQNKFVGHLVGFHCVCPICVMIVTDPQECEGCNTAYCYHCIKELQDRNMACTKKCQGQTTVVKFKPVHPLVLETLNQAKFECKCPMKSCKKEYLYEEAIEHYYVHNRLPVRCIQNCNMFIENRYMEYHCLIKCENSKFTCSLCSGEIFFNKMSPKAQEEALKKERGMIKLRQEIAQLTKENTELRQKCKLNDKKIILLEQKLNESQQIIQTLKQNTLDYHTILHDNLLDVLPTSTQIQFHSHKLKYPQLFQQQKQNLGFKLLESEQIYNELLSEIQKINPKSQKLIKLVHFNNDIMKLDLDEMRGKKKKSQRDILYEKCANHEQTIIFIKTSFGKLFGCYVGSVWDENKKYESDQNVFLFYVNENEIKVCVQSGEDVVMVTNRDTFIGITNGFRISNNRESKDSVVCQQNSFLWPKVIGYPVKVNDKSGQKYLCLGGGQDSSFRATEIEIFGVE